MKKKKASQFDPPLSIHSLFVGREQLLSQLSELINKEEGQPIQITGLGGIGKTALVANLVSRYSSRTPTFWIDLYNYPSAANQFRQLFEELAKQQIKSDFMLVIDGAEQVPSKQLLPHIINLQNSFRNVKIIITTRQPLNIANELRFDLDGLSLDESLNLLRATLGNKVEHKSFSDIHQMLQGHPLALKVAAGLLRNYSPEELVQFLKAPRYDLNQTKSAEDASGVIEVVRPIIINANDYLIEHLRRAPKDLYKLSPRKFEEVVADLLKGMGWNVTLTPATRDGGKDILASMITEIGTFLCLVEAKKYREDNHVGVSLVRELYGTLHDYQANSALLVTTSTFSRDAREFQEKHRYLIGLKDYFDLLDWIGKHKISS